MPVFEPASAKSALNPAITVLYKISLQGCPTCEKAKRRFPMRHRFLIPMGCLAVVIAIVWLPPGSAAGQAPVSPAKTAPAAKASILRTPDGRPTSSVDGGGAEETSRSNSKE